jgi:hypothetical protein
MSEFPGGPARTRSQWWNQDAYTMQQIVAGDFDNFVKSLHNDVIALLNASMPLTAATINFLGTK